MESIDPRNIIGKPYSSIEKTLTAEDAILYAVSVGFNSDPLNKDHFKFTYENDPQFQFFPTFSAAFGIRDFDNLTKIPMLKGVDTNMILHGEEETEMIQPLVHNKKYVIESKIADLQDKGKLTVVVAEKLIQAVDSKEIYTKMTSKHVIRGLGGFGYKGNMASKFPNKPESQPDQQSEELTSQNQAILYRLNGDKNPLHIDPQQAARGNFDRPILHGLCTYGISARAVYDKFCMGNALQIKKISSRFTATVFPGETLNVEMWKNQNQIYYETKVKERQVVVLKGCMELGNNVRHPSHGFQAKPSDIGMKRVNSFFKIFRNIV